MIGFKFDNVTGIIYYSDVDYLSTVSGSHASNHVAGGLDDLFSAPGDIGVITPGAGAFTNVTAVSGIISIKETNTPDTVAGYGEVYTKSNNKLYFKDGAGVEYRIQLTVE